MPFSKSSKRKGGLAHSNPQFAFVHCNSDPSNRSKDDGILQSTIRSYAMQYARRQKRWSTSRRITPEMVAPTTDDASSQRKGTTLALTVPFRNPSMDKSPPEADNVMKLEFYEKEHETGVCIGCSRPLKPRVFCRCSVGSLLASNSVNGSSYNPHPWDLPVLLSRKLISITGSETELLSTFFATIGPRFLPLDARHQSSLMEGWYSACLSHSAYMHSLCSVAAIHLFISGKGQLRDVIYHKMRAETYLKMNLLDPTRMQDESNIGAIFNLISVGEALLLPGITNGEYRKEDCNERVIHLNGLRHLIGLRGGLSGLSSKCLRTFILWHSTAHALASFGDPYMSFIQHLTGPMNTLSPVDELLRDPPLNPMIRLCCRLYISENLVRIVGNSTQFVEALHLWHARKPDCLDFLDLINWSCDIIQRLLFHLNSNPTRRIEESLAIALIMFVTRASEMVARTIDPLRFAAVERLRGSLLSVPPEEWAPAEDLHLWVCTVGALSAPDDDESSWFVSNCYSVSQRYLGRGKAEFLDRLRGCLWIEQTMGRKFRDLWGVMALKREESLMLAGDAQSCSQVPIQTGIVIGSAI
ncbi:hypothetical protein P152DRAFT_151771 [Eremomyces bilateralis CBS 781.70]|uniref:Fungal-specific transcription factor domain-containing protein n=1 Tax=Eremomyces bilateralis CBS 781.70 TaxID=1392243 RepID=A0A6G1FVT8_9PEZI|nr:uncharacterized protein P152DRAFT_151771 [Eremomyces bilateralis CBS 781.70]KAF1809828.1 hypothetical protein P152DRAFT_151771 [Eremomyces bilateralis CBS 781.70]